MNSAYGANATNQPVGHFPNGRGRRRHAPAACLAAAAILLIALAGAPRTARCEEPDPAALAPQLGDAPALFTRLTGSDWSAGGGPERAEAPSSSPAATSATAAVTPFAWRGGVRSAGDAGLYALSPPPRNVHWWKIPVYALAGAPRDLVDSFFGVVGYVPPFNLAITGVGYEVLPMQFLMRPPSDWHRWPGGRPNAKGHGWIDSPGGWGFFPNYRATQFASVDERELARRRDYNAQLTEMTTRANADVNRHNEQVQALRERRMAQAAGAYQAGRYDELVELLRDYVTVDSSNREAKAMLAAAYVALEADPARPTATRNRDALAALVTQASKPTLLALRVELAVLARRMPGRPEPLLYRVWTNLQLANYAQAVEDAAALAALDPDSVVYRQLLFEAALAGRQPEQMTPTLEGLESTAGADSEPARHARGRHALALGDVAAARAAFESLVASHPLEPRYRYLLAMTEVAALQHTGRYDRSRALRELRQAVRLAHSPADEVLYEKALRAAELLR